MAKPSNCNKFVLLCHVQNIMPDMELQTDEFSMEFELWWEIASKMGPSFVMNVWWFFFFFSSFLHVCKPHQIYVYPWYYICIFDRDMRCWCPGAMEHGILLRYWDRVDTICVWSWVNFPNICRLKSPAAKITGRYTRWRRLGKDQNSAW